MFRFDTQKGAARFLQIRQLLFLLWFSNIVLQIFALGIIVAKIIYDIFSAAQKQRHRTVPRDNLDFCQRMLHGQRHLPKSVVAVGAGQLILQHLGQRNPPIEGAQVRPDPLKIFRHHKVAELFAAQPTVILRQHFSYGRILGIANTVGDQPVVVLVPISDRLQHPV